MTNEKVDGDDKPCKDKFPTMQVSPPFPPSLKIKEKSDKLHEFTVKLIKLSINIPLLKANHEILRYAKLMNKLMSKKNLTEADTIEFTFSCSATISSTTAENKEDLWSINIPCIIRTH